MSPTSTSPPTSCSSTSTNPALFSPPSATPSARTSLTALALLLKSISTTPLRYDDYERERDTNFSVSSSQIALVNLTLMNEGVEWLRVSCISEWHLSYDRASESESLLSVFSNCGCVQRLVPVQSLPHPTRGLQLCETDLHGRRDQLLSRVGKIQPPGVCRAGHGGYCSDAVACFLGDIWKREAPPPPCQTKRFCLWQRRICRR